VHGLRASSSKSNGIAQTFAAAPLSIQDKLNTIIQDIHVRKEQEKQLSQASSRAFQQCTFGPVDGNTTGQGMGKLHVARWLKQQSECVHSLVAQLDLQRSAIQVCFCNLVTSARLCAAARWCDTNGAYFAYHCLNFLLVSW
jgi:hypothetical protein